MTNVMCLLATVILLCTVSVSSSSPKIRTSCPVSSVFISSATTCKRVSYSIEESLHLGPLDLLLHDAQLLVLVPNYLIVHIQQLVVVQSGCLLCLLSRAARLAATNKTCSALEVSRELSSRTHLLLLSLVNPWTRLSFLLSSVLIKSLLLFFSFSELKRVDWVQERRRWLTCLLRPGDRSAFLSGIGWSSRVNQSSSCNWLLYGRPGFLQMDTSGRAPGVGRGKLELNGDWGTCREAAISCAISKARSWSRSQASVSKSSPKHDNLGL